MSLDSQYVEPLFVVMPWKALLSVKVFVCPPFPSLKIKRMYSLDN